MKKYFFLKIYYLNIFRQLYSNKEMIIQNILNLRESILEFQNARNFKTKLSLMKSSKIYDHISQIQANNISMIHRNYINDKYFKNNFFKEILESIYVEVFLKIIFNFFDIFFNYYLLEFRLNKLYRLINKSINKEIIINEEFKDKFKTLKNYLKERNVVAYFFGPPGTGKTSMLLKVLSKKYDIYYIHANNILLSCTDENSEDIFLYLKKLLNIIRKKNIKKFKQNIFYTFLERIIYFPMENIIKYFFTKFLTEKSNKKIIIFIHILYIIYDILKSFGSFFKKKSYRKSILLIDECELLILDLERSQQKEDKTLLGNSVQKNFIGLQQTLLKFFKQLRNHIPIVMISNSFENLKVDPAILRRIHICSYIGFSTIKKNIKNLTEILSFYLKEQNIFFVDGNRNDILNFLVSFCIKNNISVRNISFVLKTLKNRTISLSSLLKLLKKNLKK